MSSGLRVVRFGFPVIFLLCAGYLSRGGVIARRAGSGTGRVGLTCIFVQEGDARGTVLRALARNSHGVLPRGSGPLVVLTRYRVAQCIVLCPPITRRGGSNAHSQLGRTGSSP